MQNEVPTEDVRQCILFFQEQFRQLLPFLLTAEERKSFDLRPTKGIQTFPRLVDIVGQPKNGKPDSTSSCAVIGNTRVEFPKSCILSDVDPTLDEVLDVENEYFADIEPSVDVKASTDESLRSVSELGLRLNPGSWSSGGTFLFRPPDLTKEQRALVERLGLLHHGFVSMHRINVTSKAKNRIPKDVGDPGLTVAQPVNCNIAQYQIVKYAPESRSVEAPRLPSIAKFSEPVVGKKRKIHHPRLNDQRSEKVASATHPVQVGFEQQCAKLVWMNCPMSLKLRDCARGCQLEELPGHGDVLIRWIDQSSDVNSRLLEAVKQQDILTARKLCAEMTSKQLLKVGERHVNDFTPVLHIAAGQDNDERCHQMVSILLDHCPGLLDMRTKNGSTALLRAVYHNNISTIFLLIDRGADVNLMTERGFSIVHHASDKCDQVVFDRLWQLTGLQSSCKLINNTHFARCVPEQQPTCHEVCAVRWRNSGPCRPQDGHHECWNRKIWSKRALENLQPGAVDAAYDM